MPDGTGTPPPAEDDFDRALRELTEKPSGPARFHEPSAEERAKAGAKRAAEAAKRAAEANQQARQARATKRRFRRRQAGKAVAWTAAIALVVGGVAVGWLHFGAAKGGLNGAGLVTNGAVPGSSASPGSSSASPGGLVPGLASGALSGGGPSSVAPPNGLPPADPFAGTPADGWADGAAGIFIPADTAVGPFSAAQVQAAYVTTKQLLIAQNLDPATLRGGTPTAFMNLLPAQERQEFVANLNKSGLAKDGSLLNSRGWVASFAPGTTVFIGKAIKVHGTMSARAATYQGHPVLYVHVNYRFVYPVERPQDPAEWMRVVGQVTGDEMFQNLADPGGALQPWFSALPGEAGARCDATDGYIHPDYPNTAPDKVQPTGAPIDPYSMSNPELTGCTRTTGT